MSFFGGKKKESTPFSGVVARVASSYSQTTYRSSLSFALEGDPNLYLLVSASAEPWLMTTALGDKVSGVADEDGYVKVSDFKNETLHQWRLAAEAQAITQDATPREFGA